MIEKHKMLWYYTMDIKSKGVFNMKNTIIASIVAILCTLAICITYGVCTPKTEEKAAVEYGQYLTETEAADYLGVTEEIMQIMRERLKYLDGAYIKYTYVDDNNEEVDLLVYNKDKLDAKIAEVSAKSSTLNFKYIQDKALEKAAENTTAAK